MPEPERTAPMVKKVGQAKSPASPVAFIPKAAPAPEPTPSPRTKEARKLMTKEEVEVLHDFITRLTESAAAADSVQEQRRLLFDIGNELRRLKPDSAQTAEVLGRMKGFQIDLGQKKYQIEQYLARGAFGVAFVVKQAGSHEEDVLKLSLPFDRSDMFVQPDASGSRVMQAEQIRNTIMEAAALSRLSQYDVPPGKPRQWLERRGAYPPIPLLRAALFIPHPDNANLRIQALVMEKIEGERLDQVVKRLELARNPDVFKQLTKELIAAVRFLHNRGVMHSDLKLSNVILDTDDHPYLLDFGSAQVAPIAAKQNAKQGERVVYGQVDNIFANKEYVTGFESTSAARDVYALGVVLRKIAQGNHMRRKEDQPEKAWEHLPLVSQQIVKLTEQMTLSEPSQRPNINELLRQLEAIR